MSAVVVDTNIISYLIKNHTVAQQYRPHLENRVLVVSFMTVAELDRWAIEHNWGSTRKQKLETYLRNYIVHPFDRELCSVWAKIMIERQKKGRRIRCADAWIAACAVRHDIPLLTHNLRDFDEITGLKIITENNKT
ncbi:MAG: type II toxin-antitoxin system VapC family toxin [Deltaproteobacteria bacterium]|nr:MAG: type II toxin-antitoxin system VapC family toxin [Deltaproteobacteria bacterium]RLB95279.1 MAG: type II toxin-antitoxin system VapC family toxin [Deltaproteobacteria bacterium]